MMVGSRQGLSRLQQEFLSYLGGLEPVFEAKLGSSDFELVFCQFAAQEHLGDTLVIHAQDISIPSCLCLL